MTIRTWLPCARCKGTGLERHHGNAVTGPRGFDCANCQGLGALPPPDFADIIPHLFVTRGKRKGGLKRSAPKAFDARLRRDAPWDENVRAERGYRLWRMVRFYSGADMTMPWFWTSDPWSGVIDDAAHILARRLNGAAGAARWSHALTGQGPDYLGMYLAHPGAI